MATNDHPADSLLRTHRNDSTFYVTDAKGRILAWVWYQTAAHGCHFWNVEEGTPEGSETLPLHTVREDALSFFLEIGGLHLSVWEEVTSPSTTLKIVDGAFPKNDDN